MFNFITVVLPQKRIFYQSKITRKLCSIRNFKKAPTNIVDPDFKLFQSNDNYSGFSTAKWQLPPHQALCHLMFLAPTSQFSRFWTI